MFDEMQMLLDLMQPLFAFSVVDKKYQEGNKKQTNRAIYEIAKRHI